MSDVENYKLIQEIANSDVLTLIEKGKGYGRSWIKRGGVGAFMMLARKWDRIENQAAINKITYDIIQAGVDDPSLLDDISDLRAYLLLVQAEIEQRTKGAPAQMKADYVPVPCFYCGLIGGHTEKCPTGLQRVQNEEGKG